MPIYIEGYLPSIMQLGAYIVTMIDITGTAWEILKVRIKPETLNWSKIIIPMDKAMTLASILTFTNALLYIGRAKSCKICFQLSVFLNYGVIMVKVLNSAPYTLAVFLTSAILALHI